MFNLRKKAKQMVFSVKQSLEPVKYPQALIAEIHEEFDTATDKLLAQAKDILCKEVGSKGERLKKLGFISTKSASEAETLIRQQEYNLEISERVEYFRTYYPNQKFITEVLVSHICKKYGLLFGDASYYIGDVPEKNIVEMENFKLREDDLDKLLHGYVTTGTNGRLVMTKEKTAHFGYLQMGLFGLNFIAVEDKASTHHYDAKPYKICASVKDFDTHNMRIEDGYKLQQNLPDPIVLQPVKGGYLIVTKWGLEASDELVVNEINN